jgi:hypothetical protein
MNIVLSIIGFLLLLSCSWLGGNLDSNARIAIRIWGSILSVAFLVVALTCSWAIAILGLALVTIAIVLYSRFS